MTKIRMIVSAAVVLAVVSTSLAFKSEGNAFACIQISPVKSECQLQHSDVVRNSSGEFSFAKGAITSDPLQGADCTETGPCNAPIQYSLEN